MNKFHIGLVIITAVVIAGGGGFWAGVKYQSTKISRVMLNAPNGNGAMFRTRTGERGGSRPVSGEILAVEEKSLTVKLPDGSTKLVFTGDSTVINKAAEISLSELQTGERVMILGTENSDGSLTATAINLGRGAGGMGIPAN